MRRKNLLIAISALFFLTYATSCGNGKGANDKSDTVENIKNSNKDDAERNDSLIRDFITNMYENSATKTMIFWRHTVQRRC